MIILNEKKYAEDVIKRNEVGEKPAYTLFILAKYYAQCKKFTRFEIFAALNDFMAKNYKDYKPSQWEKLIEDYSKKAVRKVSIEDDIVVFKYPIKEIDHISISKTELDVITSVDNEKYSRLLFVMLCYAKYYNICSEKNNNWINTNIKDIYRSAKVNVVHREDKFLYLNSLMQMGLISFSNKNDNLNIRLEFVDNNDEELVIKDFRELGLEYMRYKGDGFYTNCLDCGVLIKKNGTKVYRCPSCAYKNKLLQKKQYYKAKLETLVQMQN